MNYSASNYQQKLSSFFSTNKTIIIYVIKIVSIYFLWKLFSWFIGEESHAIEDRYSPFLSIKWEAFCDMIRVMLLEGTALVYSVLGYDPYIHMDYTLYGHGIGTVSVGNYCLGIQLWVLFAALILSYPGKWKSKILYVLFGVFCINIINIIRITAISFAAYYYPEYIQFNHDYVFNGVVYLFSFYLVYLWVKK